MDWEKFHGGERVEWARISGRDVGGSGFARHGPALKRIVRGAAFFGALPDTNHRDANGAEALLPRINAGAATLLAKLGGA